MAYQSLYRKYRPQNFHDVMGQGHVVRTLQNALASGRIAHGYLFTGTRGTAKTTMARLLAKALNCESAGHPVTEPCNVCEACLSITQGSATDVIELDAASHRGVADIEEVRKQVGYGPMSLRYKVFIIDEAHQLSSDAKDAFLKTLEEPPANVVFVLATTEPQAIPITIRSRCQQFDFKRGSLTEITTRLQQVLDEEGITFSPEALTLIARGAEGSYRDSLSLLEQVLAFSENHIDVESVNTVLGSLDSVMLERVILAIASGNAPEGFTLAGELLDAGKEARTLLKTLSLHFRDLLLVSVGGPAVASELTAEEVGRLQAQARHFTTSQMTTAIDILSEAQQETRWNNQHRLLVEMAFLKLMTLQVRDKTSGATATLQTAPIVFNNIPAAVPIAQARPIIPIQKPSPKVTQKKVTQKEEEVISPQFFEEENSDPEDDYEPEYEDGDSGAMASDATAFQSPLIPVIPEAIEDEDDYAPDYEEVSKIVPTSIFDVPVESPPLPKPFEGPNLFGDDKENGNIDYINGNIDYINDSIDYIDEPEIEYGAIVAAPPSVAMVAVEVEPEIPKIPEIIETTPITPVVEITQIIEPANALLVDAAMPGYDLEDIKRIWPRFIREAERISKRAAVMMNQAYPTGVEGNVIVITFRARANHDMMSQPEKIDFVRGLLAVCLGRGKKLVPVRFILAPDATVDRKVQQTAVRYDPKAKINELAEGDNTDTTLETNSFVPPPASAYAPTPRYNPEVIPARSTESRENQGNDQDSNQGSNQGSRETLNKETLRDNSATKAYNNGTSQSYGEPAPAPLQKSESKADKKAQEKIALALEDTFVQEILTVFGGEVLEN